MFRNRTADSTEDNVLFGAILGIVLGIPSMVVIQQQDNPAGWLAVPFGILLGITGGLIRTVRTKPTFLVYKGPVAIRISHGTIEISAPDSYVPFNLAASSYVLSQVSAWCKARPDAAEAIIIRRKGRKQELHSVRLPGRGNLPLHGRHLDPDFALDCKCGGLQRVYGVSSLTPQKDDERELTSAQFTWRCTECYSIQRVTHYCRSSHALFTLFADGKNRR